MNSNLFHNILNILIAVMGLVTAVMLGTGCTTLADAAIECSQSWVDPTYTAAAIACMGVLKSVINIARRLCWVDQGPAAGRRQSAGRPARRRQKADRLMSGPEPFRGTGLWIRIQHRFHTRMTEWLLAIVTGLWGLCCCPRRDLQSTGVCRLRGYLRK
ncbi:hypothetical protein [Shinella sp. M27]|uniref:hypothetical protein n=1 Tax=Shinella sp. M27 TaxID=3368614 RepID=UPI003B9DFCE2